MDFDEVIRRQRMVRPPYSDRPVERDVVDRILAGARKAPSAGYSQGFAFLALHGEQTEMFTSHVWPLTPPDERRHLPVVILPLENKQAYLDRYSEPDKVKAGLGGDEAAWPVPFWTVDTAFATMAVLLSATAEGVGAWFFGIFTGERELLDELGVPGDYRAIGAIALGYASDDEVRSPSLARGPKPADEMFHHGRWLGR